MVPPIPFYPFQRVMYTGKNASGLWKTLLIHRDCYHSMQFAKIFPVAVSVSFPEAQNRDQDQSRYKAEVETVETAISHWNLLRRQERDWKAVKIPPRVLISCLYIYLWVWTRAPKALHCTFYSLLWWPYEDSPPALCFIYLSPHPRIPTLACG